MHKDQRFVPPHAPHFLPYQRQKRKGGGGWRRRRDASKLAKNPVPHHPPFLRAACTVRKMKMNLVSSFLIVCLCSTFEIVILSNLFANKYQAVLFLCSWLYLVALSPLYGDSGHNCLQQANNFIFEKVLSVEFRLVQRLQSMPVFNSSLTS